MWEATEYFTPGHVPAPLGSAHRMTAPYQAFRCADGYITIGAANDRNFAKLARVLGHHEWLTDARFVADHQRVAHRDELAALIEAVTVDAAARRSGSRELEQAGIPCGPILDYEEALDDAAGARARDDGRRRPPDARPLRTLGTPIKMSATPLNPKRRAPMLGEHTDDVLAEAGYSATKSNSCATAALSLRSRSFDVRSTIVTIVRT